jgi:hypothetical protein
MGRFFMREMSSPFFFHAAAPKHFSVQERPGTPNLYPLSLKGITSPVEYFVLGPVRTIILGLSVPALLVSNFSLPSSREKFL